MYGEKRAIARSDEPITMDVLRDGLSRLGVGTDRVVLTHVSLSQLGWVCGGSQAVLDVLVSIIGQEGTLVMPAFSSDWTEPSQWQNPPVPESWWQDIRDTMPAYDPLKTPTRGLGRTAELFRRYPEVVRGPHPQCSFAALGQQTDLVFQTEMSFPFGKTGVLNALYEANAQILLLGCGYESCTALHLAEQLAVEQAGESLGSEVIQNGAPCIRGDERQWVSFDILDTEHDDFVQVGEDFERDCPEAWTADTIGIGLVRYIELRALVDYASQWFVTHRAAGHS